MRQAKGVTIIGGGLAGLTLALQLLRRRPELEVVVVDPQRRPAPERRSTVGESFSELGSHYLRDVIGLADHLEARQLPKFGLRFIVGDHDDFADRFELGVLDTRICQVEDGRLLGLPLRTHQVDRARLENELAVRCVAAGVELLEGSRVEDIQMDRAGHRLELTGDHAGRLLTRWVVFAAGARIPGREPQRSLGHRTRAAWVRVEGALDVGAWSTRPEFLSRTPQGYRRLSTTHLLGKGYWMWLIPLPSDVTSVGIVSDPDVVDVMPRDYGEFGRWIAERDPRLARELSSTRPVEGDWHAGDLEAGVAPTCFSDERWAVIGQAAAFVDVLYSPGTDLIALGNTLVTDLVERDLATGRPSGSAAANRIFHGFAEGLAEIYRGQYANFGRSDVVGTKVLWDSALYFGFNAMLFRHGLSTDARFLSRIKPELLTLRALQGRIQARFRRGEIVPLVPSGNATVEWGSFDWMMDAYYGAERQSDDARVVAQLRSVLASLERIGRRIEGTA